MASQKLYGFVKGYKESCTYIWKKFLVHILTLWCMGFLSCNCVSWYQCSFYTETRLERLAGNAVVWSNWSYPWSRKSGKFSVQFDFIAFLYFALLWYQKCFCRESPTEQGSSGINGGIKIEQEHDDTYWV